jgi:ribosomal protein L3
MHTQTGMAERPKKNALPVQVMGQKDAVVLVAGAVPRKKDALVPLS